MSVPPDKSPDRITPGKSLEPTGSTPGPKPSTQFESYMQGAPKAPQAAPPPASQAPSPMEAAKLSPLSTAPPTLDSLVAQARQARDTLGTVEQQLNTPNLKLKRSQSHLLRNKLQDSNANFRAATDKLGLETPPMKMPPGATAIDRFLAYINDGQDQLMNVQKKLKEISASGQEMRPADMLYVQIKISQAQQEIEYSSTLLSKVVDSLKTIINVQL